MKTNLNPFISIWLKPRNTIAGIVQRDSSYMVNFITNMLVVLPAIRVSISDFTDFPNFILELSLNIIFGAISILIGLYLWGCLITFVGQKIGGKGIYKDVAAVVVWSIVPLLFLELFHIMAMIVIRTIPGIVNKGSILVYRSITGLMILWSLVIGVNGLSEVHKIPLGKSFWCLLISFLIAVAFLFSLGYMIGLIRF
ncbi:MAG: YIP1 family protein [Firmicutes bacterium]|nr:YIP1 family protein [Bacillota bacterium]